jgi:hypothetical protein
MHHAGGPSRSTSTQGSAAFGRLHVGWTPGSSPEAKDDNDVDGWLLQERFHKMIIGRDFAWGHLGKTAGDATYLLFKEVAPDLIEFAHEPTDRAKHQPFSNAGAAVLLKETLVLNIRRLATWTLSSAQHRARHGTAADPTPQPVPPSAILAGSDEADRALGMFTGAGRIRIDRWLRSENLREDFIEFVSDRRTVTPRERELARSLMTKPPGPYDHDLSRTFTNQQIRSLYANNPLWANAELQAFGFLPFQAIRRFVVVHRPGGAPHPARHRPGDGSQPTAST